MSEKGSAVEIWHAEPVERAVIVDQ